MEQYKKFISPGAWFTMLYPAEWNEFESGEGSFLFYNPSEWNGNFRISAYRGSDANYVRNAVRQELKENPSSVARTIAGTDFAYSREMFEEEGAYYTSHLWVGGKDDLLFECSFTVPKGGEVHQAEQIISSLEVRKQGAKYPAELIPIRIAEVYQINEAYEWVSQLVKDRLKKDFQGMEEDIPLMQQVVDAEAFSPKKKEVWLSLGIVLCVILANEVDGWEWQTLIDGNREAPVLQHIDSRKLIDPMKLVWSKVKAGTPCNLEESYMNIEL